MISLAVPGMASRSAWRSIANQGPSFSGPRLSLAEVRTFPACCVTIMSVVAHFAGGWLVKIQRVENRVEALLNALQLESKFLWFIFALLALVA